MKIYLKKRLITVLLVGFVLFVGTFILISTLANKNRNYVVEESLDINEDEHMNMFNDDIDVKIEDNDANNSNQIENNTNEYNEIKYDDDAEEQASIIDEYKEKIRLLELKLNDTIQANTKENKILNRLAYKHLNTDIVFNDFDDLRDRAELHTYLWRKIYGEGPYRSTTPNINDVILNPDAMEGDRRTLAILHRKLFPWLYRKFLSPASLLRSYKGRGIVLCTGSFHFRFARSTVDSLRNVIKTDLPIEIFYNGESDLSLAHRKQLEEYDRVFCTDITQYFDNDILFINGWAIKPFALLASRFEEVILIDADSAYIRDPALWFEDEGYKETGTLLFKDRTLYPGPHRGSEWLHSWMKEPGEYAKNSRFYNELSSHELESSTVVVNKNKRLLGLLLTCKFNERKIRDRVVYQNVFGDKETYWMAYDMAREPYSVLPRPIAYIGEINYGEDIEDKNQKQLCGHIGHTDRDGKIMFWNDHIIKDKHDPKYDNKLLRFEGWFFEDLENVQWTDTFHCANIKDDFPINEFTEEEKKVIDTLVQRELENKFVLDAGNSY